MHPADLSPWLWLCLSTCVCGSDPLPWGSHLGVQLPASPGAKQKLLVPLRANRSHPAAVQAVPECQHSIFTSKPSSGHSQSSSGGPTLGLQWGAVLCEASLACGFSPSGHGFCAKITPVLRFQHHFEDREQCRRQGNPPASSVPS